MVGDDDFRETVEFEDIVNEQARILFCRNFLVVGDKMYYFCESVDKYGNGGHPLGLWKISNVVFCNLLLIEFWQGDRLE